MHSDHTTTPCPRTRARRLVSALVVVIALASSAAGCSSAATPATTAAPGAMVASDAWARASMSMDRAAAAYVVIRNETGADDALVGVSSPAAATVELHETAPGMSGMMAMHPVDRIEIAAGESATLEPGGYHVMLIDLPAMLEVGSTIELTLTFEHAAPVTVTAEVRAN